MSEGGEFLPRVIVETSKTQGSLKFNFSLAARGFGDVPPPVQRLNEILLDWTSYCIASIHHMPSISAVGHIFADINVNESVLSFLKSNAISFEETIEVDDATQAETKRASFIIHDEDASFVASELATTNHIMKAATAIQRSNLSALIAEFDFLLYRILTVICTDKPEKIIADDEAMSIGYIRSGKSPSDWQAEQIERRIGAKLRGSHDESISWILTDIVGAQDISVVKKSEYYRDFLEICQRRHIFIHNGGIVNRDYLSKCEAAGIKKSDLAREGSILEVDPRYLARSAARVYLVGTFVLNLVMQRLYPEHASVSYRALLSVSHDFLCAGMTKMAERVIDFAEYSKKNFEQDLRLKFGINRALAKLHEPKISADIQVKNAKAVLDKYDWSVTTPVFDLALACIKREFDDIVKLAKKANESGLKYQDARSFFVFKEAREIEGFMDCFPRTPLLIAKTQE